MSFPADHLTALSLFVDTVRDGNADAIHDTRVATRRVREALPLLPSQTDGHTDALRRILRKVGRALGRARDGDVALGLLQHMARRRPAVGPAAAAMRLSVERERLAERRRLVKVIESTDFHDAVAELLHQVVAHGWQVILHRRRFKAGWERLLGHRITHRASTLRRRIDRAGGVYFPNRVHAVRIAAKKLRYALEIADAAAVWRCAPAINLLKETQDTLGHAHDCQLLIERTAARETGERASGDTRDLLAEALEADVQAFHRRYLRQRDRLRRLAGAAEARASDPPQGGHFTQTGLLAAGTLIVPLALWFMSGGRRSARDTRPRPLDVRLADLTTM
jgi:CHAD domain-containing protein